MRRGFVRRRFLMILELGGLLSFTVHSSWRTTSLRRLSITSAS